MPKFRLVYDIPTDTIPFPTADRWTPRLRRDPAETDPVADAERILSRMDRQVRDLDRLVGDEPLSFPGRFASGDGDDDGPRAA